MRLRIKKKKPIRRLKMKRITNVLLTIALLATMAFADGDMGNGATSGCTENCPPPPPPCTENCPGMAAPIVIVPEETTIVSKVVLVLSRKYFGLD
jgi:hypothetical protein